MEYYFSKLLNYLLNVLQSTFNQLFILFGPLLILILLLNFSAIFTSRISVRFWGQNLFLYGFGWLGCSVHELSHAFFALIFGHKITEIKLFTPSKDGESLGHVSHSYNKKNIYHKIGNFFIGISPLLAGGIVLFFSTLSIFSFNIPELSTFRITSQVLTDFLMLKHLLFDILNSSLSFLKTVFVQSGFIWWKLVLLLYILYSIGSSMTLSKSDVGSAFSGFLWLIVFFLIFNLMTLWIGNFASDFLVRIVDYISVFYFLLIITLMTNLLFIIVLLFLNYFKKLFVKC